MLIGSPYTLVDVGGSAHDGTATTPATFNPPNDQIQAAYHLIQFSASFLSLNNDGRIDPPFVDVGDSYDAAISMGLYDTDDNLILTWSVDLSVTAVATTGFNRIGEVTVNSQGFTPAAELAATPFFYVVPPDSGGMATGFLAGSAEDFAWLFLNVQSDVVILPGTIGYYVRIITVSMSSPQLEELYHTGGFSAWTGTEIGDGSTTSLVYDKHAGALFYFHIEAGAARVARNYQIASFSTVGDFLIHSSGVTSIYAFQSGHILCCVYGTAAGIFARVSTNEGQSWSSPVTIASNVSAIGIKFDPHSGTLIVICKEGTTPKRALCHLQDNGTLTAAQIANTTGLPSGLSGGAMDGEGGHYALVAKSGTDLNAYVSQGSDGRDWTS